MTLSPALAAEYAALTAGAGFVELAGRTLIDVSGADAVAFLHSFTTSDIKKLPVGRGCEAFVTSPQGKTLGHVLILRGEKSLLLCTTAGQAATLIGHWERYVISEDVTLRDLSTERTTLLVAGARAAEVLHQATGAEPPGELLAWSEVSIAGDSAGDISAALARVEYAGPNSYFLIVPNANVSAAAAALEQAGSVRCSVAATEMVRIEAGFPLFGQDITDDNLPQEIGRDAKAISFTKGCYLGQETIARIDALGHVNRQLVGVRFFGDGIPSAGTPLAVSEKVVGHVTSAAWSPRWGDPLAIALVRRAQAKPGTELASPTGNQIVVPLGNEHA
jgi:folate-binding protein YgfZ